MARIRYSINAAAENDAFIEEFGDDLSDEQFEALDGFRDDVGTLALPDANEVDPLKDPVTARRVLLEPLSKCTVSEKPFVLPLIDYLNEAGADLPAEVAVLSKQHDFYLLRFSLDAKPGGEEQFVHVEVKFDYPKNHQTYRMTPDTQLETKFGASGKVNVGVDAKAGFTAWAVEVPGIVQVDANASASIEGGLAASWEYELVEANVIATGIGSSFAEWIFKEPKRMVGNVPLATILAVPKETGQIRLDVAGSYSLSRGLWWWKRETMVAIASAEPIVVDLPGKG